MFRRRTSKVALIAIALLAALAGPPTTVSAGGSLASASADGRADAWWNETTGPAVNVNGTYTPIVGDFASTNSGDDIIWYAPGSTLEQVWVWDGTGGFAKQKLNQQVTGTYTPVVGNFGGNALDDILWYGPGTAPDVLWIATASHTFSAKAVAINGTYRPVVIDDETGLDELLWKPTSGTSGSLWKFGADGSHTTTAVGVPAGTTAIVGHFATETGCGDVFLYGPGTTPDTLWDLDCAGHITAAPQTVNGTFTPVVQDFTPTDTLWDDILWYRPTGASVLWDSDGDRTWTSSGHTVGLAGTPIPAVYEWGYLHIWSPTAPDALWWVLDETTDHKGPVDNTEIPAGYTVVNGLGDDGWTYLLWYKPGTAPEYLFH